MFFHQQNLGASDIGITEMVISRCIVAKLLQERGVLPANYKFYDEAHLTNGYNYESLFSFDARIETLNQALELLDLGTAKAGELEDGVFVHLEIPGLVINDYDDFFITNEHHGYEWQADSFIEENQVALEEVNYRDTFYVKFTDFTILPHQILQSILDNI